MYSSILHIRLKQVYKAYSDLGLFRSIVAFGLIIFLIMALYTYISKHGLPGWITAGYLAFILIVHVKRPDKRFLKINVANHRGIQFFEYTLLAIPLVFFQLYLQLFDLVAVTILILFVIPFMRFSIQRKGLNNRFIRAIPDEAFEWKSGARKYYIFMVIVWFIGLIVSSYVVSVPVAIVILGLVMVNFYKYGESLSLLMSQELGPKQFLFRKILAVQAIFSVILLPLVIAYLIFHLELWFILLFEYVLISFILWYAIFLKYTFYKPNQQLITRQLFTAIGAMSLFIPLLIPFLWILSVRFYFKSITNLNLYLDDFN